MSLIFHHTWPVHYYGLIDQLISFEPSSLHAPWLAENALKCCTAIYRPQSCARIRRALRHATTATTTTAQSETWSKYEFPTASVSTRCHRQTLRLSVCPYVCLSVPLSVCLPLWLVSIKLWFCLPCNTVATLFAISPNRRRETEIHRERVQEIFKRDAFSINGYRLDCSSSFSCRAPSAFRSTDD